MTYDPNNPIPYYGPQPAYYQPNPRPTSVTVIAILAIIFGGIGTACGWLGILPYVGVPQFGGNAFTDMINQDPALHAWTVFTVIWAWAISIVTLAAGILSLKLNPLGRKLFLVYGWASLAMALPGLLVNVFLLIPKANQLQAQHQGDQQVSVAVTGAKIGAFVGLVIGLAIIAVVFWIMNRPHVKAAFASGGGGAAMPPLSAPYVPPPGYPSNYPRPPGG
jgi:hypothetical protein